MDAMDDWCMVEDALKEVQVATPQVNAVVSVGERDRFHERSVDALLPETTTHRSTGTCSRDLALSLLSPTHRRYVVHGKDGTTPVRAKRTIAKAFAAPSRRVDEGSSFPNRLRSMVPSCKAPASEPPTTTAVTTLTFDHGTQTTPSTYDQGTQVTSECSSSNAVNTPGQSDQLRSALERNMHTVMELKAKSAAAERFELRAITLEALAQKSSKTHREQTLRLHATEHSLRLAQLREMDTTEYLGYLKTQVHDLRDDNALLKQQLAAAVGGADFDAKSIAELERLETAMEDAMSRVRRSLRAKYHAAIQQSTYKSDTNVETKEQTPRELCVVCLTMPVCVRLEPCHHEVLCSQCAVRVRSCPVDRAPILDRVLTHGLDAYTKD